jgi:hypothetical protein
MIARHENHAGALLRFLEQSLDDVIVELIPVPAALESQIDVRIQGLHHHKQHGLACKANRVMCAQCIQRMT